MLPVSVQAQRRGDWETFGWQGITVSLPRDWYPAALGVERSSGYLRIQNADGFAVEVKWFSPKHTVDLERELAKYRQTLEKAARKKRQDFEWRDRPRVPAREARPDKSRRFFGWRSDSQALGVIWYCRTCSRVILAQVVFPLGSDACLTASHILNSIEDHGHNGHVLWSVYGLGVLVPEDWGLDKHQLMAGYTMLQFRKRDQLLRAERWALANVALKETDLHGFVSGKSARFWKDYALSAETLSWREHPGVRVTGRTRKPSVRAACFFRRFIRRPGADWLTAQAWHCEKQNKIFAVHVVHPRGEHQVLDMVLDALHCH